MPPPFTPSARTPTQARYVEGQALFEQAKWDEALAAYRAAVEKDPEMSEAWYQIGLAEMAKACGQRCEAAYGPLKRCLELNPDHADAHNCFGNFLLRVREDLPRAEEHLRAAIRLDPNFAAHRSLAAVLEKRGDLDGAIRAMLEFVHLSGDPDGSGNATVAKLLEKKKADLAVKKADLAAREHRRGKPALEAEARPPPPLHRGRARPRALQPCRRSSTPASALRSAERRWCASPRARRS